MILRADMNLLVCFQIIPDLDALSPEDWNVGADQTVELRFAPIKLGGFEESALELARRIAQTAREEGQSVALEAAAVGDKRVSRWMKSLFALGYDTCLWQPEAPENLSGPESTVEALSQIARERESDLILLGAKSSPWGSGQTAPLLAEYLGLPYYGGITNVRLERDRLLLESASGDSILLREVPPRGVLAIGNAPSTMLPVPTLKDRMAVSKKEITVLPMHIFRDSGGAVMEELVPVVHTRTGAQLPDGTPEKLAAALLAELRGGEPL